MLYQVREDDKKSDIDSKYYIGVTQDGLARITRDTPDDVIGIVTEGLIVCLGIVLYGTIEVSLIHYDGTISLSELQQEFTKVMPNKWEIWRNSTYKESAEHRDALIKVIQENKLTQVQPTLRISNKITDDGASFYIKKINNGEYIARPGLPKEMIKYAEDINLRHCINMINHMCGDTYVDEQYSGTSFNVLPKVSYNYYLNETILNTIYQKAKDDYNLESLTPNQESIISSKWRSLISDYQRLVGECLDGEVTSD